MRALQLQAIDRLVEVELSVPEPKPDEVLVRTVATTICTSELNDIAHNPFGIALPRVMGHEGAGVVAAVGESVSQFRVGDRVAAHPVIPCRTCENCRRGLGHLCSNLGHLGLDRDGTFAEFFCIRADRARRLPAGNGITELRRGDSPRNQRCGAGLATGVSACAATGGDGQTDRVAGG
jgi:threonine dehydrogenase-like Zn-dependent dehydrogenase